MQGNSIKLSGNIKLGIGEKYISSDSGDSKIECADSDSAYMSESPTPTGNMEEDEGNSRN